MSMKETMNTGVAWFFGALLALVFAGLSIASLSIILPVLGIIATAVVIPPGRDFIASRMGGWRPKMGLSTAIVIGCFMGSMVIVSGAAKADAEKAAKLAKKEEEDAAALALSTLQRDYAAKKAEVTQAITSFIAAGQFTKADGLLNKYQPVAAADLKPLAATLAAARARQSLKDEGKLSLAERVTAYQALVQAEPANAAWGSKLKSVQAQLDRQVQHEKEEEQKQQAMAARREAIKKQFSAWDGSNLEVERAVKAQMKNPKSYEHVETKFKIMDKGYVVFTTIRGTNGFGGVVPQSFMAKVTDDGRVISLDSE